MSNSRAKKVLEERKDDVTDLAKIEGFTNGTRISTIEKVKNLEYLFVVLGYSLAHISRRYDLNINLLKIYQSRYKWIDKRKQSRFESLSKSAREVHRENKTLRSSQMWQDMREKVEEYMISLEPVSYSFLDGKLKVRGNEFFLDDMNKCKSILKDVRTMERLDDDMPTSYDKNVHNETPAQEKSFLNILDGEGEEVKQVEEKIEES